MEEFLGSGFMNQNNNPSNQYQLTLGSLIKYLRNADQELRVWVSNTRSVTAPHSYRGYYSDLALEPTEDIRTVGQLLAELKPFLDATIEKWGGGPVRMTQNTPMWYANNGEHTGTMFVGLSHRQTADGPCIFLITKQED